MTIEKTWWNTEFVLFQDRNGEKVFLRCVAVERIVWGSFHTAKLILRGPLPQAFDLIGMEDGVCIELLKGCHPDPYNYEAHELVFRFYDGKVRRKWTPHFISITANQGAVDIYVSLECRYQDFL